MMCRVPTEASSAGAGGPRQRRSAVLQDPELAAMQVLMPRIDIAQVAQARAMEEAMVSDRRSEADAQAVETAELSCPRPDGTVLALRSYRPRFRVQGRLPVVLFVHGGSFVTGGLHSEDARCARYAAGAGCVVVALDYRLAPEHPFPAAVEDCVRAASWLRAHARDLGADGARFAVGGLSAGGALAAEVARRAAERDEGPPLVLQMLLFPVLDASVTTRSARLLTGTPVLTSQALHDMWRLYLGPGWRPGAAAYPRGSSPAHETDLSGAPATFICTAGQDPLRDEAVAYARRLIAADVPVDLRCYARGFHSFDSYATTRMGQVALRDQLDALRAAFA